MLVGVLTECFRIYACVRARVHVCTCGLPAYFVILIARGRPPPLRQPHSAPSPPTRCRTAPLHPMLAPHLSPLRLVLVFHSTSPIRKPSTLQPPVTRIFLCRCTYDDIRAVINMYPSYIYPSMYAGTRCLLRLFLPPSANRIACFSFEKSALGEIIVTCFFYGISRIGFCW